MSISPTLGELNAKRYKQWKLPFNASNAYQAIFVFKGEVYINLDAASFNNVDINFKVMCGILYQWHSEIQGNVIVIIVYRIVDRICFV